MPSISSHLRSLFLTIGLLLTAQLSAGQDLCSCNPTRYQFRLAFENGCPGSIMTDSGVADTACSVVPESGAVVTNLVPIVVTEIEIVEFNRALEPIGENTGANLALVDNQIFEVASLSNTDDSVIIGSIQLALTGENSEGETIVNTALIQFTNDCSVNTVFETSDAIGWLELISFEAPNETTCSASGIVAPPTDAPLASPTLAPVAAPTDAPVATPTDAPVETLPPLPEIPPLPETPPLPVVPTPVPVVSPSPAPVVVPTLAPVTPAPISFPTVSPVAPTLSPVVEPPVPDTMSLSMGMSMRTSFRVTNLRGLQEELDELLEEEFGRDT